ncbi:probable methyltransferase TARBP1 [Clytia hemisphaerica]|uniref:tRNA (guanosine(18)-2'-O)-methyltransferase TARBP1 n=1 Tax=Clytia hemisphaerica TaxID=252671 RepID=A0A7M6DQR0_9CNID
MNRFIPLVCRLMLMEWLTEKDFVVLNQIASLFLSFGNEEHKKVFVASMEVLYQQQNFSLLLLLIAIHLDTISSSNIIQEIYFWKFLQDGLVCSDPLPRKRALFVIKYILDVISKQQSFTTKSIEGHSLVFWESNKHENLWKIWKSVALVLETLEEKQVHVINPVLPTVDEILLASVNGMLHHSWLLAILEKAMAHESKLIQTWAVKYSLSLDINRFPLLAQSCHGFIFDKLFESLKNIFLYCTEEDTVIGDPPKLLSLLRKFFFSCFGVLDGKQCALFCSKIISKLSDSTFNQIALIYITMALSKQELKHNLSPSHVQQFQSFLMTKIPIYSKQFQTIIFQNISNFYSTNLGTTQPELQTCLSLVSSAYRSKVFALNSKCWEVWCKYFQRSDQAELREILKEKLTLYLDESTTSSMANTICSEVVIIIQVLVNLDVPFDINILKDIQDLIQKIPTNPYVSQEKVLKTLKYVDMQLNKYTNIAATDQAQNHLLDLSSSIIQCVQLKLFPDDFENDINQKITITCINVMGGLSSFINNSTKISSLLTKFNRDVAEKMTRFNLDKFEIELLINLNLLSKVMKTLSSVHLKSLKGYLIELIVSFDRKTLATQSKESQFNCDMFISSAWSCFNHILQTQPGVTSEQSEALYSSFQSDISMASTESTLILTQFSKHFIQIFDKESDKLQDLVDNLQKIINNHIRDGQTFWPIYKNCIQAILHKQLLCTDDDNIIEGIKESWDAVFELGERKMAVTSIAAEDFFSSWNEIIAANPSNISYLEKYIDVFIKIGTFGPLRQKKEKPFHSLFTFLEQCEEFDQLPGMKSFQQHDQQVRISFVDFILHLPKNNQSAKFADSLIQALTDFDQRIVRKCFYANSLIHRQKLRCWQAVLILLPKLPCEFDFAVLLPKLFTCCKADNQPSVKYLIEWVIVLILLTKPQLVDLLIQQFDVATEKKIFSVTYILSTLIQLTKSISDDSFKYIVDKTVLKILPWAQCQHLTSRVHSHVLLELMSKRIESVGDEELIKKYHFLPHCFTLSEKNTAAVKHRKELARMFYVSTFNAVTSYNLEILFHTFLKEHSVLGDEWIQPNCFTLPENKESVNAPLLIIRRLNVTSKSEKVTTGEKTEQKRRSDQQQQQEKYIDTQKKIMPWNLIPSDDLMLQSELSRKKDLGSSDLILCAVLVDKIPNLGGLARTSEIFGVKRLVIGSNRYLGDPSFKSLSVTSEKWLDIEQVIPIKLASYLDEMRNEGYTIVGVEQTANSQMIGQFKFPPKSVLVLGNEKTGIPVEIIQLLDECVEIPQLGIIRSLNVHISGAIMIWEYCKQHSLPIMKTRLIYFFIL